ncbi:MAG: sulfite exporter TauE/SafE family protein [Myxococcaceae bacterium]
MKHLVLVALVGLVAQFIDGALGMAYGATTATLLLAIGLSPVLASTTTHLAELGTTVVSGVAHNHFGNVDWRAVAWLGIPGGLGALAGATVLARIDADLARPWMSGFLLFLGASILIRFAVFGGRAVRTGTRRLTAGFLVPLGLLAGFLDAAGGGGWGPLGTSTLMSSGRIEPRRAIGTIDTSEFIVAFAASVGFVWSLGTQQIPWAYVVAILAGGVLAAPLAAWVVRKLHPRILGTAVGGVILLTNLRTVLSGLGASDGLVWSLYPALIVVWLGAFVRALLRVRRDRMVRET